MLRMMLVVGISAQVDALGGIFGFGNDDYSANDDGGAGSCDEQEPFSVGDAWPTNQENDVTVSSAWRCLHALS